MAARWVRYALAAALGVTFACAALLYGPMHWLGAVSATAMAGPGRWRLGGAVGVLLVGAWTFTRFILATRAATASFGAEADAQAALALQGASVAFGALVLGVGALGLAPETRWARGARVGTALAVCGWAATAYLACAGAGVHAALAPLSPAQALRTWGPAAGALAAALFITARCHPRAWLGALLVPGLFFGLARPDPTTPALPPAALRGEALDGARTRPQREGAIVEVPTAGAWRLAAPSFPVAPGRDALPGKDAPSTSRVSRRVALVPGFAVPAVTTRPQRVASWLVPPAGEPTTLDRGWTPAPELDATTLRTSLLAAAGFLERNQLPGGKFTYIVRGPSGEAGPGYNYPRHAGTTWFLARVAVAFTDTPARSAALAALQHLEDVSGETPGGRAFILDPTRKDGRAWIGTTALAVLAVETLAEADRPPTWTGWTRQVIASVGADGKVRGEIRTASGEFVDEDANAYGQGQVMLALAAIARAPGEPAAEDAVDALRRASAYVGGVGYYGLAEPPWVADEHWMCLAAHGIHALNALGGPPVEAAGPDGVCRTYAATEALSAPPRGAGLPPSAGPGGGAAEAIVARAWDHPSASMTTASLDYARLFLGSQYQPGDAPMLARPDRLLGGFRDGTYDLDVQIDAVQHIGGALLGTLAILEGQDGPGRMP